MTQSQEPVDTFALLRGRDDDPPQLRYLRAAVLTMAALLVLGFFVVIGRVAYLAMRQGADGAPLSGTAGLSVPTPGATVSDLQISLPPGAKIRDHAIAGTLLSVHYEAPGRDAIVVVDLATGREVARVRFATPAP